MLDLSETSDASATYVGKMAIDPDEDRQTYFQDAEMQNYSMEWAKKFNESKPPKLIEFVRTWVVELVDRPDRNLYVFYDSLRMFNTFDYDFSTFLHLSFVIKVRR